MSNPTAGDKPELRPYLAAGGRPERAMSEPMAVTEDWSVRAYTLTGGRVHTEVQLAYEAMLMTTEAGIAALGSLTFERAAIVEMCQAETLSVAEVSARLDIAIGVVRVLAADLITDQLVLSFVASQNVADDVHLIMRLISGVRAL
jgi:hypothetical protein